ncbi:MAG: uridine monophosphate kinase [Defluviitaleaceae bacterium]|nr:uridine monophosphate kinase [Defluviitaleaceae bacterium]
MLKRVVIKLSGEAIGSQESKTGYNDKVVDAIVKQIIEVKQVGTQVALIIGGGNLWRGIYARPDMNRVKADQMGMLATVMNAIYLTEAFKRQGQNAKVVTPIPFGTMTSVYEKDTALEWMSQGIVLVNAAGLGHPYFSTDTVTALRAAELEADCILYAKNISGVYDSDPRKNPNARKFKALSYSAEISRDLKVADLSAMHLAREAKIPSYVFGLNEPNSITLACAYPKTENLNGTYISVDIEEDYYD